MRDYGGQWTASRSLGAALGSSASLWPMAPAGGSQSLMNPRITQGEFCFVFQSPPEEMFSDFRERKRERDKNMDVGKNINQLSPMHATTRD